MCSRATYLARAPMASCYGNTINIEVRNQKSPKLAKGPLVVDSGLIRSMQRMVISIIM